MKIMSRVRMTCLMFHSNQITIKIFGYVVSSIFLLIFIWLVWNSDGLITNPYPYKTSTATHDDNNYLTSVSHYDDISSWIFYDNQINDEIFPANREEGTYPVLATTIRPQNWMIQHNDIAISNESERVFDIESLLLEKNEISISMTNLPQVLIVHTHGTESYNEGSLIKYSEDDYLRSTDTTENVVAVGSRMADLLNEAGYKVIHDTTMHDDGNYNGSYSSSRKAILKYLEEYPSIKIVLDVHRDTVITENEVKYRTIWENNGKSAAQVMILLGAGGSKYANEHWEENLKLALHIYDQAEKTYPDLMRPLLMRSLLYNQDLSSGGLLVEIGTCGNTLDEAILGAECFTECLINVLNLLVT